MTVGRDAAATACLEGSRGERSYFSVETAIFSFGPRDAHRARSSGQRTFNDATAFSGADRRRPL